MNISINGKPADITLENEKTIGDILSGLEKWLSGTGNRLSGMVIDGDVVGAGAVGESMDREIASVGSIDIVVSSWPELAVQALIELGKTCALYQAAAFEERREIASAWETNPAASFLALEVPDAALFARHTFSGGKSAAELSLLTEERIRELENPQSEILAMQDLVSGICTRMGELPLDIQTGKDSRAAETMQMFSRIGEKLFRLLAILKSTGFSLEDFFIDGQTVKAFNDEFGAALGDLCSAYDGQDTVLVGDLAEYELAPRLLKLYGALKEVPSVSAT